MSPTYFLVLSWVVVYKATPFAGWAMSAAPVAPSSPPATSASVSFSGETVDGDLPTTYRLPPLPPSPATSVTTTTQTRPLFGPPLPENACPVTPPTHAADAAGLPLLAIAAEQTQLQPSAPSTPAGSPPDDRLASGGESEPPDNVLAFPPQRSVAPAAVGPLAAEQCVPTDAGSSAQLLPAVQRGYELAQRGALFAARTEFVQVLRRVAQAKGMAAGSDNYAQALAAGLRAIDEAEDFVPEGVQLEAELDVRATASSHRTPALPEGDEKILPHEAVVLYHAYAKEQLAAAVSGEQAGSMALYGLGRIDAQLAARKDDDVRFVRGAMTMYAAALAACPSNHLAANELGVLECRTGRPAEAVRLFQRTIDFAPSATAYHNLGVAQQKLGLHAQAYANEQESQRLAVAERAHGALSRRAGVEWVTPEELARVVQPAALTPASTHAVNAPNESKSPWQRAFRLARSLPPGSTTDAETQVDPSPDTRVVWPSMRSNQTRWR